jgi:large subunit ribosomal protein L10
MALKKEKKVSIVENLENELASAQSVVFVKFDKLKVADANALRRSLQKEGIGYAVSKKTLLKRALVSKSITGDMPELQGQIAVAYGTDLLAPAREVFVFHKTHKDNISIVGGVFEGKYMDKVMMESIANIPPREVLLAQIAYLLKSPIQRLAIGINAVAGTKTA